MILTKYTKIEKNKLTTTLFDNCIIDISDSRHNTRNSTLLEHCSSITVLVCYINEIKRSRLLSVREVESLVPFSAAVHKKDSQTAVD